MNGEIQKYTMQLCESLNLEGLLTQTEDQVISLKLDEDLIVQYTDLNPGLHLMSYLGPIPEENQETLLMSLMRINLFGKGTKGGVLGFEPEKKELIFTHAIPYALTYLQFKEALEDFMNYVELWKKELNCVRRREKSLLVF